MNKLSNLYLRAGVLATTALASIGAMAQESDAFETAVTAATAKIGTYGAALVGVAAAGVVLMIGVKYVKKIRGAA